MDWYRQQIMTRTLLACKNAWCSLWLELQNSTLELQNRRTTHAHTNCCPLHRVYTYLRLCLWKTSGHVLCLAKMQVSLSKASRCIDANSTLSHTTRLSNCAAKGRTPLSCNAYFTGQRPEHSPRLPNPATNYRTSPKYSATLHV